jgi:hypothetical protein
MLVKLKTFFKASDMGKHSRVRVEALDRRIGAGGSALFSSKPYHSFKDG